MKAYDFFRSRGFRVAMILVALASQIAFLPAIARQPLLMAVLAGSYSISLVTLILLARNWRELFYSLTLATAPIPVLLGLLFSAVVLLGFLTQGFAPHRVLELMEIVGLSWVMMVFIPGWPILLGALGLRIFSRWWGRPEATFD